MEDCAKGARIGSAEAKRFVPADVKTALRLRPESPGESWISIYAVAAHINVIRAFMKIRHQTWSRFTRVGSILAVPFVLFLFVRPHWGIWSHRLEIMSYIFLFSLAGTGALLAILTRVGVVRMSYSDPDKQSMDYKLSKIGAQLEKSQGRGFAGSYYEDFGVKPPQQRDSNDKSAA